MDNTENSILFVTVPYAGGSSIAFSKIFSTDGSVEFYHHEYPGHGIRAGEEFKNDFYMLADELANIIRGKMERKSELFIMGHSMGAMVSFFCENILEKEYGIYSRKLILSACLPPEQFYEKRMRFLDDEEKLKDYLAETRKIPSAVLESRIFRNQMLMPFQNDVKAIHSFVPKKDVKISADLCCISADQDIDITSDDMSGWSALTSGAYEAYTVKGDHFYFEEDPEEIKDIIRKKLEKKS